MKHLIINADDLGADEARNEGIFEAIAKGRVTSASILANGPALPHALPVIQSLVQKKISWGIHLNLSEGTPLASELRLLTDEDGRFLGKTRAHSLLSRQGDKELEKEVKREVEAQIEVLRRAGIPICHLDGHQHVHVFPAVIRAAIETVGKH
jgi:chitin disaccharide deacetylase